MGTILKIAAGILALGLLALWGSRFWSANKEQASQLSYLPLSASVIPALGADAGLFDKEGVVVMDTMSNPSGIPYLQFTEYASDGTPKRATKRLSFLNQDACADLTLPCATDQPGVPVSAGERVRVRGEVRDDLVMVTAWQRL